MNPQSNERSGLNLPPPVGEQSQGPQPTNEVLSDAPETVLGSAENSSTGGQALAAAPLTIPLPSNPMPTQSPIINDVGITTDSVVPQAADDGDLIEKEWVNKAKQIVNSTRDDPHEQSKELTVFKADYMKKRYNKTVKFTE